MIISLLNNSGLTILIIANRRLILRSWPVQFCIMYMFYLMDTLDAHSAKRTMAAVIGQAVHYADEQQNEQPVWLQRSLFLPLSLWLHGMLP